MTEPPGTSLEAQLAQSSDTRSSRPWSESSRLRSVAPRARLFMPTRTLSRPTTARLRVLSRHSLSNTRSTTQHPRTCGPPRRQWSRMSSSLQPASWSASASIGIAEKSRDSYICEASARAVSVRHSGENRTGRNGFPKMSRTSGGERFRPLASRGPRADTSAASHARVDAVPAQGAAQRADRGLRVDRLGGGVQRRQRRDAVRRESAHAPGAGQLEQVQLPGGRAPRTASSMAVEFREASHSASVIGRPLRPSMTDPPPGASRALRFVTPAATLPFVPVVGLARRSATGRCCVVRASASPSRAGKAVPAPLSTPDGSGAGIAGATSRSRFNPGPGPVRGRRCREPSAPQVGK